MRPLLILAALLLAGCATDGGGKPPVCDGKHRRSANPYGSVLSPKPAVSTPPAATTPKVDRRSSLGGATFGSCA